jgi:hypothetical protein
MPFTANDIGEMLRRVSGRFEDIRDQLGSIPYAGEGVRSKLYASIEELRQNAQIFASSPDKAEVLQRIVRDANIVLDILSSLPLPPQLRVAFRIAQIIQPALERAAAMVIADYSDGAVGGH